MTLITPDRPDTTVQIDSGDSFWIENYHPTDTMHFKWANIPYNISPMKKRIVPFEVVALNFGDPRSKVGSAVPYKDSRGHGTVPERYGEVRRLSVRYGVYEQGMEDIRGALQQENLRLELIANNPLTPTKKMSDVNFYAKIKTLDDTEVITPLFDPDGHITYGYTLDEGRSDDITQIIANFQKRIAFLEGQKDAVDEQGDNDDGQITIDNPGDGP